MTNDPTQDLTQAHDLSTFHAAGEAHAAPAPARRDRRRSRLGLAAAALLVAAVGLGGLLGFAGGADDPSPAGAVPVAQAAPLPTTPPSVPPAPADEVETASPDPGPAPEPGHLVVSDTHIVLTTNDFDDSFQITNDGGSDIEWSWSGNPTLAVSTSGGVLAPGESVVVSFTISWQQLTNGGFIYQSYVDTEDQSIKVTVTGTRDIEVNPGIELPKPELLDHDHD